jgi:DNA invertase Pin-like site-specific DNA recombinase
VLAALYERELRDVGVPVYYAVEGVDSSTPEGELMLRIMQEFDHYGREKIRRESRRGMRENAEQGFRSGGTAPYGYTLERLPHPNPARAKLGETKSKLKPDPERAPVVQEIFALWEQGYGVTAIADRLNERGVPCPSATNPRLNVRGDWAKSTVNSSLRNPAYVGKAV